MEVSAIVERDASAALGIIHRRGLDKTRHLEVGHLWVQEVAATRAVQFGKVPGPHNPAGMLTRGLTAEPRERYIQQLVLRILKGRPRLAPKVV